MERPKYDAESDIYTYMYMYNGPSILPNPYKLDGAFQCGLNQIKRNNIVVTTCKTIISPTLI